MGHFNFWYSYTRIVQSRQVQENNFEQLRLFARYNEGSGAKMTRL